jgi:hypothetical protein
VITARPLASLCLTLTVRGLPRNLDLLPVLPGLPIGVALSTAVPDKLVKTGTRALVPVLLNLENAIPATRRTACCTTIGLGGDPTLRPALIAVLVSTSSVAATAQTSVLPASSKDGT